ncbi:hypothetical protein [Longimicrobium sp.]|uniref:hypothetical protein n=1 Tax=Longimicrobium sp. TaxID=2029185 RepID=UPI003B3B84F2
MHLRSIVHVTAACLTLAACESSTGSTPVQGIYNLTSVNGRPLPATLDSVVWEDGITYTLEGLERSSVEIMDGDSALYTISRSTMTRYASGSFAHSGTCSTWSVPYRIQGSRLLLIVEPALLGQTGRLRLDTLEIGDDMLVRNTRSATGAPARLEYTPATQPARCPGIDP